MSSKFDRVKNLSAMLRRVLAANETPADEAAVALIHASAVAGHQAIRQAEDPAAAREQFRSAQAVAMTHAESAAEPGAIDLSTIKPATKWVC